jgi:hypothetical protein
MTTRGSLNALAACLRAGPDLGAASFPSIEEGAWRNLLAISNRHLLTPALGRALIAHRARVPDDVLNYVEYVRSANRQRNRSIRRQAIELIRAFNRLGLEPLLLKGILMTLHERRAGVGTRMMADIDIVVPEDERHRAIAALHRLGYRARVRFPSGHHAVGEFTRETDPAAVDLHIELVDQKYILPAAEVRDAADRVCADWGTYLVPNPTHRVLHNILHAQVHHRGGFYLGEIDLRQLFELAYLGRVYERRIDWTSIEERLCRHRLDVMLHSYLRNAGDLMGLPWPLRHDCLARARFHVWRTRTQFRSPVLGAAMQPWANLRLSLAWHRMAALHGGEGGGSLSWRCRHIQHVLAHMPWAVVWQKILGS